ncbi:hypothetical protein V6Z05_08880 [Leptospira venezuelensis]|uniref:hypothetical protein n=1 Tax=Leptospira venezuelensis TaxID=1958811 RepID=UPI000A3B9B42|nr:hypothetical protein [Leptospira venezuelensis]
MKLKKFFATELRWIFFLFITPLIIWGVCSLVISTFNLDAHSCKEGERLTWERTNLRYYCERNFLTLEEEDDKLLSKYEVDPGKIRTHKEGDAWDRAEFNGKNWRREADSPIIREATTFHGIFFIITLILYPISALIRAFVWAFKFKE